MLHKTLLSFLIALPLIAQAEVVNLPVTVTAGNKQVTLKWTAVPNITFYGVCYKVFIVKVVWQNYQFLS